MKHCFLFYGHDLLLVHTNSIKIRFQAFLLVFTKYLIDNTKSVIWAAIDNFFYKINEICLFKHINIIF